jgi:arylsulfatase A-like enzyme
MSTRPNILILFTDMQRADTIHALGNPVIRTPSLDRLAAEGTAFTSCYTPSPVCVSARCCMHYGQYPQRTGQYSNGPMMEDNGASLPALLGAAGYRSRAIGKCHFSPEREALRGFQSRLAQEEIVSDPEKDDYRRWLVENGYDHMEPHGTRGEMYYIPQVSRLPAEAHPSQWIGDRAVDFIGGAPDGEPWMLFSSFVHPHPPLAPPKPWHKLYRAPLMPLPNVPPDSEALYTWVNRHQNRYKYRDQGIDLNLVRLIKAYYYACISFVDYQVGRVLAALEERGQLDDTLILYTSDHGELLGDYNCFGKRSMHDPAARVPMLARQPGRFAAGQQCSTPVSLVDVLPTVAAATGVDTAGLALDGVDLASASAGEHGGRTVYAQFDRGPRGIYMAVDAQWKYCYSASDESELLFDRIGDPLETRNRAGTPFCGEARDEMRGRLLGYLQGMGEEAAYDARDGELEWRRYPADARHQMPTNPDAGLLVQDARGSVVPIPNYSD